MISNEIIESFIFCKYKTYLILNEEKGNKSDYATVETRLYEIFKTNFLENVKRLYHECQIIYSTFPIDIKSLKSSSIIISPEVKGNDFLIGFDAIDISITKKSYKTAKHIPIVISPKERISRDEKLSLTIKILLLNRVSRLLSEVGKIIYGRELKSASIRIKDYKRNAQKLLDEIVKLITDNQKPLICRNEHCRICEFEESCKKHLLEKDDLSLLGSFSLNEIIKRNKKGLFTINQLSYNFRPKRFKKIRERGRPFSYELKALALRDNKTYILDLPSETKTGKTDIYIDFEGLPDEDFIYLIGLIIKRNNSEDKVSLWADSKEQERYIFQQLFNIISEHKDFVVYHYGSYETKELKRALKTYPDFNGYITAVLERSVNLLSYFYSSIYTPTYTNELKEIGRFLGFDWAEKNSSGIQSIAWRKNWELSQETRYKNMLIRYNSEDCQVLTVIKSWIDKIRDGRGVASNEALGYVKDIKIDSSYKFGKTDYLIQDFERINNCSYFNYQREKIFIKTNLKIKKVIKRQTKLNKYRKVIRPDAYVELPIPKRCPKCGDNRKFYMHKKRKRLIQDLKFIKNGIKRWVTEYERGEFRCSKCFKIINSEKFVQPIRKNLYFWVINQYIAYGMSFNKIVLMLSELFNIEITRQTLHRYKSIFAVQYDRTYKEILCDIIKGPLLHIDETKIKVGGISGYVWILTNIESVCYLYKPSREADFLKELLRDFKGVLISDFYSAYDSIECPQQKCLIHLIRDLNDDLIKNQFDCEFKEIVIRVGTLLRNIMETIERYGLKQRHLNKYKKDVKNFFNNLITREYKSELALQYQKRFKKNQDKLFTFLNYDEIPWNNNNAEHAIKHLARYRRNVDGLFSKKGVEEYLILLSIYQTCKYKGLNFLQFLLSGEKSVFVYFDKHYRHKNPNLFAGLAERTNLFWIR